MASKKTQYWLMKSEPEVYGIDHLKKDKKTWWEGVRNYQARNFMMQEMSEGDLVFFYHSNAEPSGIAGICRVSHSAEPDKTQFDSKSEYFEPKSTKENPRWFCVQVEFVKKFENIIPLSELKEDKKLQGMAVLQKGQRLSVQPVSPEHFQLIEKMAVKKR